MDIAKVEEIKNLIGKAEIESAKSQGIIENIKKEWVEVFGTDDIEEIEKKLQELEQKLEQSNQRKETLYKKLISSYDWDSLAEELGE